MNKYQKLNMEIAEQTGKMSHCRRKQVGATLVKENRILVNAYNGTISGADNCCEDNGVTRNEVVHAEINIISFAAKKGISTEDCELYVTLSPCIECAKTIIQSGIKKVFYRESYREDEGVKFLSKYMEVVKI